MREILFRGKTDTGRWVYGDLMQTQILFRCKTDKGRWMRGDLLRKPQHDVYSIVEQKEDMEYYLVDKNTIGQYTGLTDKNGTGIFEGDILKIVDDEGNTDFSDGGVGNVEFAYGLWYVSGKPQNGLWDLLQAYYCEVLGNIYDNPELLKGAEK